MKNFSIEPTYQAKIDSTLFDGELLGKNELGSVYVHGPLGNTDSPFKIAYLIGMHPLESKAHRALFEEFMNYENPKYCYYIYNIDVKEVTSDTEGRMEGQLLAQEFVRDDIIGKEFDLFLDIHSNRGSVGQGKYEITNFVFAPGFDDASATFVEEILDSIGELEYYVPEYRTSPGFITEPTAKAGIPTIIYECFSFEPIDVTKALMLKLIDCVDNLDF